MADRRLCLALLFSLTGPAAWAQRPAGPEFQVNTHTLFSQYRPAVGSGANGKFVVVWQSYLGVLGQSFDASGVAQGGEFRVNSYAGMYVGFPAVASDTTGDFVVVWQRYLQDGSDYDVFGQRFSASAVAQGSEFRVNSYTTNYQHQPAVASDANGNFVVVWESWGQGGSVSGVFGQRFNAAGVPQGGEFQVNSYTTRWQTSPAVASDPSGNFIAVWQSEDGSHYGIFGRRFDALGIPQGGEFQVNSYTTGPQIYPAVAMDVNGNFVVVWTSGQDGSSWSVVGQGFDASGLPQGAEFQINSYTSDDQRLPVVASDADGSFVVVWQSVGQDGSGAGIFGQRFDAFGARQGRGFRANSYTIWDQAFPAVASGANGNFVVVWESDGQDGSGAGIFGQRYGDLIFRDGFE